MRKPRLRPAVIAAITLCLAVVLPAASADAARLPPGVHVDPGSPAAKEYQIPLGAARGNGQSSSSAGSQLFGSGITPSRGNPPPGSGRATASTAAQSTAAPTSVSGRARRGSRARTRAGTRVAPPPSPPAAASPARAIGTDSSAGIGITWMLGAAVLVLLLGALGGAVLGRRGRRTSPHPG